MNQEIDIEFNELGSNRQVNNLDLIPPNLKKYHSTIEKNHHIIKINKKNSLPDDDGNDLSHITETPEFKIIWLLNHLSKLSLDMNRCYVILEKTNLEENLQMEVVLNNFLNRYFSDEDFNEPIPEDNPANNPLKKSFRTKLIAKLFDKHQEQNEINDIKLEKVLIIKENYENPLFSQLPIINEEIKLDDDVNKKQCLICYEMKNLADFIKNDKIAHDFCSLCLISYVTQKIFTNQIIDIKCPDDCGVSYTDEEIHSILTNNVELYNKYEKFKKIAILSQDPNIRWCVRAECTGYMKGDKLSKKLICDLCGQEMCFLCRNAWHEGQNCEQAMNSEFKKYVERVEVKDCPKCKSKIEKNEGCNHMTCSRCHYQFCWICLGQYSSRHYEWFNLFGCPNMQYSRIRIPFKCYFLCKIIKFLLVFLLYLIAAAIGLALSPIFIVVLAAVAPFKLFYSDWKPSHHRKCARIVYKICFPICVIILLPLEIILAIVPGSCILGLYIIYGDDD